MFTKNTSYVFPPATSDLSIHHDVLSGHYFAAANAPASVQMAGCNNPLLDRTGYPTTTASMSVKKQAAAAAAAKKDRHSKIYTSQGPRDRRVRLSIGIARKFFDLQELLGFDKPSKTLDWLLTKSKTAIKDLMTTHQTKQTPGKDPAASSSSHSVDSSGNSEAIDCCNNSGKAGKSAKDKSCKDTQQISAKESRVKARARARERAREKMCIKQMNESINNPIHHMNNQLSDFCRISSGNSGSSSPSSSLKMNPGILHFSPNFGHDLVAIKPKATRNNPSSIWGFQQNLANSGVPFGSESWDFGSSQQSNLYGILEHHRFINSSSNN